MSPKKRKWNRIVLLLVVCSLVLPLLSGCWDSREIEKRATVLALGIDKAEPGAAEKEDEIAHQKGGYPIPEDQMIEVSAQIAIPGRIPLGPQIGGGEKSPVLIIRAVGHSIEDALLSIQQEVAEEIFLGHLRLIVLNEEVAREGVSRFNDYLRRNPEIRRTASLVVSEEKASKYMEIQPELDKIPSLYLAEMVDNFVELGKFPPTFIGMFWTILSSKGQDGYLPYFKIKGKAIIQIDGLAYFNGDKMVGKTTPQVIGIFMSGIGAEKGGYGVTREVPKNDQVVLMTAVRRKTKVKASLKNGEPHILVKIRYDFEIEEVEKTKPTNVDKSDIQQLEKELSQTMPDGLEVLIDKTQKARSDIFGFGEHFRAKFPDYWNKNVKTKEKWGDIYQDLTYDVEVKAFIRRTGMKAH